MMCFLIVAVTTQSAEARSALAALGTTQDYGREIETLCQSVDWLDYRDRITEPIQQLARFEDSLAGLRCIVDYAFGIRSGACG